jgi:predicted Zn-dependent protease
MSAIDISEAEVRALLQRTLGQSRADHCEVSFRASARGNLRTARNAVSTAGMNEDHVVMVRAMFGRRSASTSANQLDDATLRRTVHAAEELARLAPEDPEWVAPLGPQPYTAVPAAWSDDTARLSSAERAGLTAPGLSIARERGCFAASYLEDTRAVVARLGSTGLFGYHRSTDVSYSVTVRTADDAGSGSAAMDQNDVTRLDTAAAARVAAEKAVASRERRPLAPGTYPVILEPLAAAELLELLMSALDARSADEGRSAFSRPGGGTRIGEKLFSEAVTLRSDPADANLPGSPWAYDGRPYGAETWIERGTLRSLHGSRYWAQKSGAALPPPPSRYIVEGGGGTLEELIRGTERAVLVTRLWYIRSVDPRTLLYTGLTRDGTFLVEDGRIVHAVNNFRFNESPVAMLQDVQALSAPVRANGAMVPAMRLGKFGFTSVSDAV